MQNRNSDNHQVPGPASTRSNRHFSEKNSVEDGLHYHRRGHRLYSPREQKDALRRVRINPIPSRHRPHLQISKTCQKVIRKQAKTRDVKSIKLKQLEEWNNKEPHLVILEVVHQIKQFEDLLDSNMSQDMLVLVLKILAKLCLSPFKENKAEIINLASKDRFIARLQNYVVVQLSFLEQHEHKSNALFLKDVDGFFGDLIAVFESLIETIPTKSCEVLPKIIKSIEITIPILEAEQNLTLSTETKEKFVRLQVKSELCKTEIQKTKKSNDEQEPPNDFRQLSVYPTTKEIITSEQAFVRRHRIKGTYDNVGQYLDVQFRLLREDFIAPLRKGIQEYLSSDSRFATKFSNVRIHPHVEFLAPHYSNGQTGVLVQYEFEKRKLRSGYKFYRRFMYGALVCFTNDNFSTLLFGKIIERDQKLLEQGKVVISFEYEFRNYNFNIPYMMVEYGIYFEPYYHVLKALQNIQEDEFPMKDYFINVKTEIKLPRYLKQNSEYSISGFDVTLSNPDSWPIANDLELDDTQYEAFKAALTQTFVVIQGPPGTGKTFLGLKIVKTLIHNSSIWYNNTPILVICYTNHALDQFLEGLTDTTRNIIRVGGQSKSEELQQFNLHYKRRSNFNFKANANILCALKRKLSKELNEIKNLSEALDEIQKFKGVLNFEHFIKVDTNLLGSWFVTASHDEIIEWMLSDARYYLAKQRGMHREVSQEKKPKDKEEESVHKTVEKELDKLLEDEIRKAYDVDEFEYFEELTCLDEILFTYLMTVPQMETCVDKSSCEINKLQGRNNRYMFNKKWKLEQALANQKNELNYLKMRLNEGKTMRLAEKPADIDLKRPYKISPNKRWRLYFYWLLNYQDALLNRLILLQDRYSKTYKQYREVRDIEDTEIMKQMTVIGMTTTCAARLQNILQALQCRIVIVEEAAEVLESHIVVSLTKHCQHLILIGDHQQLRPSTADYNMQKNYNLGISLFERMVLNNIQCYVLGVQHRMRPEIAQLIVPIIYPKLENHRSVHDFPKILGIDTNLCFIDHHYREKESGDSSKMNNHEAQFLIRLANYLLQNGYKPEDVTIIAAYSGQMFALWEERRRYELLRDVRITVLDNYQGEECRVILLSLVRNNKDNKIGFLKIENRVCVALSRAREGLYIMGNIDLLCQNSEIWPKIKVALESQHALSTSLLLHCQIHPEQKTKVRVAKDFDGMPEGNCTKMCGVRLKCGHTCRRICHLQDKEHENIICPAICLKILCQNNHECKKRCYEECGKCRVRTEKILPCSHTQTVLCSMDLSTYKCQILVKTNLPCGHVQTAPCFTSVDPSKYTCQIPVEAILPCGHKVQDKPCCENTETYLCPFPCDTRVEPCGHACIKKCHIRIDPNHLNYVCYKQCAKVQSGCSMPEGEKHPCKRLCYEECPPCRVVVKKAKIICSHSFDVACSVDVHTVNCQRPCRKLLPCGHTCRKKCYESCENCQEMVRKVHPECNHPILTECCAQPNRRNCNESCPLKLPCGHTCRNRCNEPCTKECKAQVDYTKPTACGHTFKVSCSLLKKDLPSYSKELLQFCTEPCNTELSCKHICSGTCGRCIQGRIHQVCMEKCETRLICGHECSLLCYEICRPCTQACSYRCKHRACAKQCGEPCTRCYEKCSRECRHIKCKAKCWEICTVPPCSKPCQKRLECGHSCIGFCGDPCPPLCVKCNQVKILEMFPGFSGTTRFRFVLLSECNHVIESKEMEEWLRQSEEIKYKSCPKCRIPLSVTQRYSDYIKRNISDTIEIKREFFGYSRENEIKRWQLLTRLRQVEVKASTLLNFSSIMKFLLSGLDVNLNFIRGDWRGCSLNKHLGQTYEVKIRILEIMVELFVGAKLQYNDIINQAVEHINILCFLLEKQGSKISNQQIVDFQNELKRLRRIIQFYQIEDLVAKSPEIKNIQDEKVVSILFQPGTYTDELDATLKDQLAKLNNSTAANIELVDKEDIKLKQLIGMGKSRWYQCVQYHYFGTNNLTEQVDLCNKCSGYLM